MDTETIIMRLTEANPERSEEYLLVQHMAESIYRTVAHLEMMGGLAEHTYVYSDLIGLARTQYDWESSTRPSMPGDKERLISESTVLALRILNS